MQVVNLVTLTFSLDPAALQHSRCTLSSLFSCFNQPINSQAIIQFCVLFFSQNQVVLTELKYSGEVKG